MNVLVSRLSIDWYENEKLRSIVLLVAFLFGTSLASAIHHVRQPSHDFGTKAELTPYSYLRTTSTNQVTMSVLRTTADNIVLKPIAANVTDTPDYGINGGFFFERQLLSIAVMGDKPVKGQPGDYGSGWYNTDRPRGTLVWDEINRAFSVQVAGEAAELKVMDRSRYWAQGGVSMSLQQTQGWQERAMAEEMPGMEEPHLRSAAVFDARNQLYLVVTETKATVAQFRQAIIDTIAPGALVDGVFLDGDGSSQLKSGQAVLKGDTRPVFQMMALRRID
jgi:hypothetical protein